ncbi:reduction of Rh1 [Musca autumnalis]|uniref:reduction of Rh1 n=1 Tax=Musca autumnalis TaxID=221902 RepID=UPI003CEEC734
MADKVVEKPVGNPMKFPYTFSAKIAQFPLKHYIKNQWIWRYYFLAFGLSLPVFYKISKLANSPANKKAWAESQAKEHAEHH